MTVRLRIRPVYTFKQGKRSKCIGRPLGGNVTTRSVAGKPASRCPISLCLTTVNSNYHCARPERPCVVEASFHARPSQAMKSKGVEAALIDQINEELQSAYHYLAMSAESDRFGLPGFATCSKCNNNEKWLRWTSSLTLCCSEMARWNLACSKAPKIEHTTPLSFFEEARAQEEYIFSCIFTHKDLTRAKPDHVTRDGLNKSSPNGLKQRRMQMPLSVD